MGQIPISICAVVVAVGLMGTRAANRSVETAYDNRGSADRQGSVEQRPLTPLPTIDTSLQRIASAMEAGQASTASKQADQQARRDLQAQESMAWWAQLMFWAAASGTILSGIGVFLIWRTLRHTRTAARHSAEMVTQAAKATEAALRSAAVAEQALVGVERPFVVITPIRSNNLYAAYTFSNHGRTPAVIMHSDVQYLAMTPLAAPEPIRANVLQAALTPGWNVVPPSGEAAGEEIVRPGKPIVEGAERANMWLLHGYVMYRSLTGEIFVSGFGIYKEIGKPWQALRGDAFNYDERLEKGGPRKRQRPTLTVTARKKSNRTKQEH